MPFSFSRRNLFKTLAAVPCALAGYFVYRELKPDDGVIRTIGAPELPTARLLEFPDKESTTFYALGDTGLESTHRQRVLRQLQKQTQLVSPELIFLLGDNFYDAGVNSTTDENWKLHFEQPFGKNRFACPFYACLGNHDYFGNVAAQIEYSQIHKRWNMPSAYYSFTQSVGNDGVAEFFVLDTTPIEEGDYSTGTQVRWLDQKLQQSKADWKIVIGHHPLFTGGEHGRSRRNHRHLVPVLDKHQIDLYICGHDHDLQLHDTGRGWLHLVSGAGSKLRSVSWVSTTLFAQAESGFARVSLMQKELGIEIFGPDGLLYSHRSVAKQRRNSAGRKATA